MHRNELIEKGRKSTEVVSNIPAKAFPGHESFKKRNGTGKKEINQETGWKMRNMSTTQTGFRSRLLNLYANMLFPQIPITNKPLHKF